LFPIEFIFDATSTVDDTPRGDAVIW